MKIRLFVNSLFLSYGIAYGVSLPAFIPQGVGGGNSLLQAAPDLNNLKAKYDYYKAFCQKLNPGKSCNLQKSLKLASILPANRSKRILKTSLNSFFPQESINYLKLSTTNYYDHFAGLVIRSNLALPRNLMTGELMGRDYADMFCNDHDCVYSFQNNPNLVASSSNTFTDVALNSDDNTKVIAAGVITDDKSPNWIRILIVKQSGNIYSRDYNAATYHPATLVDKCPIKNLVSISNLRAHVSYTNEIEFYAVDNNNVNWHYKASIFNHNPVHSELREVESLPELPDVDSYKQITTTVMPINYADNSITVGTFMGYVFSYTGGQWKQIGDSLDYNMVYSLNASGGDGLSAITYNGVPVRYSYNEVNQEWEENIMSKLSNSSNDKVSDMQCSAVLHACFSVINNQSGAYLYNVAI